MRRRAWQNAGRGKLTARNYFSAPNHVLSQSGYGRTHHHHNHLFLSVSFCITYSDVRQTDGFRQVSASLGKWLGKSCFRALSHWAQLCCFWRLTPESQQYERTQTRSLMLMLLLMLMLFMLILMMLLMLLLMLMLLMLLLKMVMLMLMSFFVDDH